MEDTNTKAALNKLTVDVLDKYKDELEKIILESLKTAIKESTCGYFNSLKSHMNEIFKNWIDENIKPIAIESLDKSKDDIKKHLEAATVGVGALIGSSFMDYCKEKLKESYTRDLIFRKIFEDQ